MAKRRKKDDRFQFRLPIREEVRVQCAGREEFRIEHAGNISEGGIFIATDRPLAPGTGFRLTLSVAGEEISAVAQSIWTKEFSRDGKRISGMGARFLEMDEKSRDTIRRLIDQALEEPASLGSS